MGAGLTSSSWRTHPATRPLAVAAGCVAVAVASLPLPATLSYDPWAWLVWGREVGRLDLVTTGGPSWKPLPVAITTVLSVFGDHAETAWVVATRAFGLLALVAVGRLACRLAGPVAGVLAAALLLVTPDTEARYLRTVVEGHTSPLTVALLALAVDRHLAGRPGQALALGGALALDRPEAWPFVALYGLWVAWRRPGLRWLVAVVSVVVPLLWFGGDWWGSGNPWHGADIAQVDVDDTDRLPTALRRAAGIVVLPVWLLAATAVLLVVLPRFRSRRDAVPASPPANLVREYVRGTYFRTRCATEAVLAAGALAWVGLVVGMATALGYAAIGRFYLPAAAVISVLAAVGAVRVVALVPTGRWRAGAVAVVVVALAACALPRAQVAVRAADDTVRRAEVDRDADRILEQVGGRDVMLACGVVTADAEDFPRVALAWKLDVPLSRVRWEPRRGPRVALVPAGGRGDRHLSGPAVGGVELARSVEWAVYAVDCPAAVVRSQ